MKYFFRFPHTPHLKWMGSGRPRDDKILAPSDVEFLLGKEVTVEEKLDGANVGISLALDGELQVQNRGQYLVPPYSGQFSRISAWLAQHGEDIRAVLKPGQIFFGEWCAARHSLSYTKLPDWFLLFDVFEGEENRFWSCSRRNELAAGIGLFTVPLLYQGRVREEQLEKMVLTEKSRFRQGGLEGLVVRRDSEEWCEARAKLVRPDFTQAIDEHWRKRPLEWNYTE